jgi:hypothetical protein
MISSVELIHPGGETKTLPVETIFPTYISVRWGLNGLYDIHLKDNVMIARSLRARRKGKCYWKVKDIDALRKSVDEHYKDADKRQADFAFVRHNNTMPGVVLENVSIVCKHCKSVKFIRVDNQRIKCMNCGVRYVGFEHK